MEPLVLYIGDHALSSWSLRPYLALSHAALPFEARVIELDQPGTSAAIRAVSPSGRVPCLHHGDLVVHDSLAICEYVNELAPAAQLWPADRAARARARAVAGEMHSGFAALRSNMPMNLVAHLPGEGHAPEALADAARVMEIWRGCRDEAAGGPFLFGAFSIADAMFAPVVTRFATYGVALDATCAAYAAAIEALPGMRAWREAATSATAS